MKPASPIKAALGLIVLLCALMAEGPACAQALAPAERNALDIPAQPLADAITQLSEQADVSIVAPAKLITGKTSTPVSGAPDTAAAINQMLKGAGLTARLDASGVFIITQALPAKAAHDASETPVADSETITVYGTISGSLTRSLDIKRSADSIVDAVVAADIGKLPALNAAEALQRLVGVTVSREAGEGEFIGVRGLGPTFQSVTFNGVPLAVNENIRNSDQSGRQFRFRVLPADLIGGIVVTKSPTADLIDGGIGANIDIVTVRPLQCDPFVALRAYGSVDERVGRATPNGSISACWKSADERLGFAGGLSFQRRDAQFDRFQNFGYETATIDGVRGVQVPGGWSTTVEEERRRRFSLAGSAEWRPVQQFDLRSDVFYSRFNNEIAENRVTYELGSHGASALVPGSARIKDGALVAGEIAGGRIDRNAEFSGQMHDNLAVSLGTDWTMADLKVAATVSFSRANSNLDTPLQRIESETVDGAGVTYGFDLGDDPVGSAKVQHLSTTLDLTDPGATQFRRYRIRPTDSEDQDATALLNVSHALDLSLGGFTVTALRAGGQWTRRCRDYQRRDRTLTARDGVTVDSGFFTGDVPDNAMEGIIAGERSIWTGPDYGKFARSFVVAGEYDGVAPRTHDLVPTAADLRQSYRVEEDIQALYVRLDFADAWQTIPLTGNVGLRWVNTATTVHGVQVPVESTGQGNAGMTVTARVTESAYSEFLPSFNIKLDVADDVAFRLAASRSLTRPSLASLRDATVPSSATTTEIYEKGAAALTVDTLDRAAVGGNPGLAPVLSWNADASLEWYFGRFGAVTASVFYKDMSNFIAGDVSVEPMPFEVKSGGTLVLDVSVNRPQNIGQASLAGLEFGYSSRMDSGIGIAASTMLTASDVKLLLTDGTVKSGSLQGVSGVSFSITPFFDNGPFDVYLSYTYRSKFESNDNVTIASTVETDPGETPVAAGFGTLDFGAAFRIDAAFEVFAEGVNLTKARQTAYLGGEARLYQIHDYGRTFNLGIRGRF